MEQISVPVGILQRSLHCDAGYDGDSFGFDIIARPDDLKVDLSKFGLGVLEPSGKIAARLRRRETISRCETKDNLRQTNSGGFSDVNDVLT
jgi:hypothetical protein